jgi:hypothetical protein
MAAVQGDRNMNYPFTEEDAQRAYDEWGCNCGPTALAFALQIPLDAVRSLIPDFEERRYTSPTMMRMALENAGVLFTKCRIDRSSMFQWEPCLVRIQWAGPWTDKGANPKWAYRQTHWIATYMVQRQAAMVFDVNGGVRGFQSWEKEIVPVLTDSVPRANGEWWPTDVWKLEPESRQAASVRLSQLSGISG